MREGLAVAAAEGVDIPAEEADHILQKVTRKLGNVLMEKENAFRCRFARTLTIVCIARVAQ